MHSSTRTKLLKHKKYVLGFDPNADHDSHLHRGGSNEYPQCMFWVKNKKIRYTPANPSFAI